MKILIAISPLVLLAYLAWNPVQEPKREPTKLERQQAAFELYERVRPDFTLKECQQMPMPLTGDVTGENDQ